jgi:hypothetical protein
MSYYLKVLKDYPVGFWQLDDVAINASFDFNDILDNFDTYQDLLDNYNQYGSINYVATDSSGCGNDGVYVGDFNNSKQHFPLSPGGQYAVDITSTKSIEFSISNSYYKQSAEGGFATQYYNDNDFTLECWIDPEIVTNSQTTIFGDSENDIGIFWQNGNIIFKLDQDSLEYTIPFTNKVLHVVCVYSVLNAYIYINGEMVATKQILNNPFTNSSILLKSGPTQNVDDVFLADDFAVYRYSLSSSQILDHYQDKGYTIPSQIVNPDNGELFEFYDNSLKTSFRYSYPLNKSWQNFLTDDLYYDEIENYIQIAKTNTAISKEVVFKDLISMPNGINMDSSKIEWYGNNGIKVESSLDDILYVECKNGESIPQYTYANFNEQRFIYLRVTISSPDASKYLPKLYSLSINFYNSQIMYSQNNSSYISKIDNCDYYLGLNKYPIASKDIRNGLLVPADSGFNLNLNNNIKSIEFFYTPFFLLPLTDSQITDIALSQNNIINAEINSNSVVPDVTPAETTNIPSKIHGLILQESTQTEYYWDNVGNISKNNIKSIYVNGVNMTSETNILDVFVYNNLHHVVINFENSITDTLLINKTSPNAVKALYQYMSLYQYNLSLNTIIDHYNLYTSKSSYQSIGSTITVSENSVNLYNNDWLVIQNA